MGSKVCSVPLFTEGNESLFTKNKPWFFLFGVAGEEIFFGEEDSIVKGVECWGRGGGVQGSADMALEFPFNRNGVEFPAVDNWRSFGSLSEFTIFFMRKRTAFSLPFVGGFFWEVFRHSNFNLHRKMVTVNKLAALPAVCNSFSGVG